MLDPSVRAVIQSRFTVRRFLLVHGSIVLLSVLVLVLLVAYVPANPARTVVENIFSNLAATVIVFVATFFVYLMVTPPGLRDAVILPLRNVEIGEQIIDLPLGATDYWLWARSGSYFRTHTLPRLDQLAKSERRHIRIRVVIPDPDVKSSAALYMTMKRGLGEKATEDTLAEQVWATTFAVASASLRNPYLKAELVLCSSLPVLRYDISSKGALITRDAKNLPAILVNAGNPYFEMFKDAVETEMLQGKTISWSGLSAADADLIDNVDIDVLEKISGLPPFPPPILVKSEQQ